MGLFSTLKKGLSWGFAPKSWIGMEHVKNNAEVCKSLARGLVPEDKARTNPNTFGAELTVAERKKKLLVARLFVMVYVILGIGALGYAWYMFFYKFFIMAGFVSVAIALLLFSYGLRELMLFAQLRLNRNRITFKELYKRLIKGFRS